ncbi:MAG: ABC transporter permease [Gaiellaceae bacterium]
MTRVALRGLLGRKLRTALTAIAIVLGVAMISGTYVLTDTMSASFSAVFDKIYKGTDAVVTGRAAIKVDTNQGGTTPSFSESLLAKVQALPDVKTAVGNVGGEAHIINKKNKAIAFGGAPNLGFSIDTSSDAFKVLTLVSGAWPKQGEVVIDQQAAKKAGYRAGDVIGIQGNGPIRRMRLSGIVKFGSASGIGGATLAGFQLATAQQLFDKHGMLDSIQIKARPGVSPERLVSTLRKALPSFVTVRTGEAQAAKDSSDTTKFITFFQDFLLAFGGIALFVGSFVIANSLSITIAQRTREFATLRTLGASRTQVLTSIVVESSIVGTIASIIGLFLGFGLAKLLSALFNAIGFTLPQSGTVIQTRTVVVSLVVGIAVTLIASIRPAIRATRVPPIAAVREGASLPPSRFRRFRVAGSSALIGFGFISLLYGLFAHGLTTKQILLSLGSGAVLIFIGVSLVAARFVGPLARWVSPLGAWAVTVLSVLVWPISVAFWGIRHLFGNGTEFPSVLPDKTMTRLALGSALRSKQRTASTAASLMIGMALVTLVAVLATSITTSFKGAVNSLFTGDYAITAQNNFSPIPISAARAAAKTPGVEAITSVRAGQAQVFGKTVLVSAVDGQSASLLKLNWKNGSQAVFGSLGSTGAIVDNGYAKTHHLSIGSPLDVVTPTGETLHLKAAGIFKPPTGGSPFGAVTFSAAVFDRAFQNPQNIYTLVRMHGGETAANTKALDHALEAFPVAKAQNRKQFIDNQTSGLNTILNVLYILLAFSVVIALFGIVNTLVLTVFERTRELGMLRAIGTTQRQARRLIRHESVITALIGGALGIALGLIFGGLLVERIPFVQFALPTGQLVVFAVAAVIVGIVAAVFPARRAAKLNILEALQYE